MTERKSSQGSARRRRKSSIFLQPACLDPEKLRHLYAVMLRCRLLTERLEHMAGEGRLDLRLVPESGLEAILAGALIDLKGQDRIAPGLQAATARLASREPLKAIVPDLFVCSRRTGSSKRIIDSSTDIPTQINIALGAAWVFKTHGHVDVCIALLSQQSIDQETSRWALDFSMLHRLPLVYVVQTREGAAIRAEIPELPVLVVDGDDVLAVYRVAQEAIRRARQGRGPALIECQGNFSERTAGKTGRHETVDPITRLETHLQQNGHWSSKLFERIQAGFERELEHALRAAERSRLRLLRVGGDLEPALMARAK